MLQPFLAYGLLLQIIVDVNQLHKRCITELYQPPLQAVSQALTGALGVQDQIDQRLCHGEQPRQDCNGMSLTTWVASARSSG